MANNCAYDMLVVGKSKDPVMRMESILAYRDKEFRLYRVFDVDVAEYPFEEDGYWCALFVGDTAWGPDPWVVLQPDLSDVNKNGAHMSNLQEICKALHVGVEVFGEERGIGIQEHFVVNHDGELIVNDCKGDVVWDENDEPVNGIEDFLVWDRAGFIYGEKGENNEDGKRD